MNFLLSKETQVSQKSICAIVKNIFIFKNFFVPLVFLKPTKNQVDGDFSSCLNTHHRIISLAPTLNIRISLFPYAPFVHPA